MINVYLWPYAIWYANKVHEEKQQLHSNGIVLWVDLVNEPMPHAYLQMSCIHSQQWVSTRAIHFKMVRTVEGWYFPWSFPTTCQNNCIGSITVHWTHITTITYGM